MAKPQARRIPSDDCLVEIAGEKYAVHENEWVELVPFSNMGGLAILQSARKFQVTVAAAEGESDGEVKVYGAADTMMEGLYKALAPRVRAWNWTDDLDRPHPQPDGTPEPLRGLHFDEVIWLIQAAQGQNPGPKGKGSKS